MARDRSTGTEPAAPAVGQAPKCILKSEPEAGRIVIDSETVLAGIPRAAWDYRLGNRSALDWVLDQHKEKKPKDPTIRARFDTYRLKDHKERVIDLSSRAARERFAAFAERRNDETVALFRRHGVDCVRVETGRDYIVPLSVFFRARAKRR